MADGWSRLTRGWPAWVLCAAVGQNAPAPAQVKDRSVFYGQELRQRARQNAERYPWAAEIRDATVQAAEPWLAYSDDELWDWMFGCTITRSWMVWSNGFCPACTKSVPMYTWEIDALGRPWKVRCPHCHEAFPKNDFAAFYRSGLDVHGVFDPQRADRRLLFNAEHPDEGDPLHLFGVDDGEGFVQGDHRWRFIGAYLVHGQWKQAIVRGTTRLAEAYVVTGDRRYAHKAGVLLDRVADLYPTFDFQTQALVYERPLATGYVSTWHDACEEIRELAMAYDQVFDGLKDDPELVAFLSAKASEHQIENRKASFADIQRNIEDRLFQETLTNNSKINSNYPRTDIANAVMRTTLWWPANRDEVLASIEAMLKQATAVDGVTGEKGLDGYAAYAVQGVARLLGQYDLLDAGFLEETLRRVPRIADMFRFHIDTLCIGDYYPRSGDTGTYGMKAGGYAGVPFSRNPGVGPSTYTLLANLHELTGDAAFAQTLVRANEGETEGLPYDLFAEDPEGLQRRMRSALDQHGREPQLGSVNKQEWHLAILRSGDGPRARALWLDYDSGGRHGHLDGMTLGLFGRGLDLLPDLGYPPVQYGGWDSPRAAWYIGTLSHNTAVVDRADQATAAGVTTLWADGETFRAVRASGPALIAGQQFERTAALIDVSAEDFYVLDVFRVVGGTEHMRFVQSLPGEVTTDGLSLAATEDFGRTFQMRHYQEDLAPQPGWSVDFAIADVFGYLAQGEPARLRYTDLTEGASAGLAESWAVAGSYNENGEVWVPRAFAVRKADQGPLASTFVACVVPYGDAPAVTSPVRLPLRAGDGPPLPDSHVAVQVSLPEGRHDLLLLADAENPLGLVPAYRRGVPMVQPEWDARCDGEVAWVRTDPGGRVAAMGLARGVALEVGDVSLKLAHPVDYIELRWDGQAVRVVSGDPAAISELVVDGRGVIPG
ncbi:MAG TPA: heparinase II/III family protein [Armatimonadota bacterium]|nr:heparinase II/III family protein [Armatimonadota bacterium]